MSAWIVSKAHIDAMINSALEHGIVPEPHNVDALSALGQAFWRENYRSCNYRYSRNSKAANYRFEGTEASLDPSAVEMLVRCYQYQSCEHAGWESSASYSFTEKLIAALQADPRYTGEYENWGPGRVSMWGINSLSEVPTADPLPAAV